MGMFDNIKCDYPLPDSEGMEEVFQTKDLENVMDELTITKEGRLILHSVVWEVVPEEERPYYGKPEWEMGIFKMFGSLRRIPTGDRDLKFHGILNMYRIKEDFMYEYDLQFTDGNLTKITNKSRRF
jgi:hypothetical protein